MTLLLCHRVLHRFWDDAQKTDISLLFYWGLFGNSEDCHSIPSFILFRNKDHAKNLLNYLNLHENHHGSAEKISSRFAWCSSKKKKHYSKFETGAYGKSTFIGLVLEVNSSISTTFKSKLVRCLLERILKLFLSKLNFRISLDKLWIFFRSLSFSTAPKKYSNT